jgi:hypothetical protein
MRLIVIEAATLTYTVYESRRHVITYQAAALLNAEEIEDVRADSFDPANPDTDTRNDKH